jgi:hypothetical protein
MVNNPNTPSPGGTTKGLVTDALAKWEAEAGAAPAPLAEIRLDQNERLVTPFTTSVVEAVIHYLDYPSFHGYVRCNRPDCLLCKIGRQPDTRDLLPVYDVVSGAVGVLAVSPNLRPHALKPQLTPVLRQLKDNQRVLVGLRKLDKMRYHVVTLPLPADADDGAQTIAGFLAQFESGAIDLGAIYPQKSNEDLAEIPEIATLVKLRGITL